MNESKSQWYLFSVGWDICLRLDLVFTLGLIVTRIYRQKELHLRQLLQAWNQRLRNCPCDKI